MSGCTCPWDSTLDIIEQLRRTYPRGQLTSDARKTAYATAEVCSAHRPAPPRRHTLRRSAGSRATG